MQTWQITRKRHRRAQLFCAGCGNILRAAGHAGSLPLRGRGHGHWLCASINSSGGATTSFTDSYDSTLGLTAERTCKPAGETLPPMETPPLALTNIEGTISTPNPVVSSSGCSSPTNTITVASGASLQWYQATELRWLAPPLPFGAGLPCYPSFSASAHHRPSYQHLLRHHSWLYHQPHNQYCLCGSLQGRAHFYADTRKLRKPDTSLMLISSTLRRNLYGQQL